MRIFAAINLLYLIFISASSISAVHLDHEGSHPNQCSTEISAYCHADLPHEHEESHAGEESFFEHTFENGLHEKQSSVLLEAPIAVMGIIAAAVLQPVNNLTQSYIPYHYEHNHSSQNFSPTSPRAPPIR